MEDLQKERGELWMQQGTLVLIFVAGNTPVFRGVILDLHLCKKELDPLALPSSNKQR